MPQAQSPRLRRAGVSAPPAGLLKHLLRNQTIEPVVTVTDGLAPYGSKLRESGWTASTGYAGFERATGRRTRTSRSRGGEEDAASSNPQLSSARPHHSRRVLNTLYPSVIWVSEAPLWTFRSAANDALD